MKKRLLVAIALILVLVCVTLAACNNYSETLDKINGLLDVDYSKVEITLTTKISDVTLNGKYTLTFSGDVINIVYSYDKLNEISIGGSNSFTTTVSGTAKMQNGVIISDTNQINMDAQPDFTRFSFKQAYFRNIYATNNKFTADVRNAKSFVGGSFNGANMKVKVFFGDDSISEIDLSYISKKGADVSVVYKFTV